MGNASNGRVQSFSDAVKKARRDAIVGALRRNNSVASAFREIKVPQRTGWNWITKLKIPYRRELGREVE